MRTGLSLVVIVAALGLTACGDATGALVTDGGSSIMPPDDNTPEPTELCVTDADCELGEVCAAGLCEPWQPPVDERAPPCVADTDCVAGHRCAPSTGVCVPVAPSDPPTEGPAPVDCQDGEQRTCGTSKVGACRLGTQTCTGGTWAGECAGAVHATDELCDGVDNDCDGTIDEYLDLDGDGFTPCGTLATGGTDPARADCDDTEASVHPGAEERCDGVDQDCDGDTDQGTDYLCDDGNACNGAETCGGGTCQAGAPVDCGHLTTGCSQGVCDPSAGTCQALPLADGTACNDGLFCTVRDTCAAGVCLGGGTLDCSGAADACNEGVCNESARACEARPVTDGTSCDDGLFCTQGDRCVAGTCEGPAPRDCSGLADACNDALCDDTLGACLVVPRPDGTACEDGLYCTVQDACTAGTCQSGPTRDCSAEGGSCRVGTCDESTRSCTGDAKPDGTPCDDGLFCTLNDACQAGSCAATAPRDCSAAGDACNDGLCDDARDACVASPRPDGTLCDDGLFCTVTDACTGGSCGGAQRDCSSLNDACNEGRCSESAGSCAAVALTDGTPCDDGLFCTVADACVSGACGGGPRDCSGAADACNDGLCDDAADACVSLPVADGSPCDDGQFCTVADGCTAGSCGGTTRDCSAESDACNDGVCAENKNRCEPAPKADGTACEDGLFCTVSDACEGGACAAGAVRDCSAAGDACNDGVCDDGQGACVAAPVADGTLCDDGAWCTEPDTCSGGSCASGPTRDCSALDTACTEGLCLDSLERCEAAARPDGTPCDDGLFCSDGDACVSGTCAAGGPRDCSLPADPCYDGACDESGAQCIAVDNGTCDPCIDGSPTADPGAVQQVPTNTTVQLDGTGSTDPTGQGLGYLWRIAAQPQGSSAALSDPSAATPTFLGDVAGTFDLCLTVTDTDGCSSAEQCVSITVVPGARLHIELTWDNADSDLDLHYLGSGTGTWFEEYATSVTCGTRENAADCYYGAKNPDWGQGGDALPDSDCNNDPILDVDDTSGLGPENINQDILFDTAGPYTAGVHLYSNNGANSIDARVRIYVDGALVLDETRALGCQELWEVAEIEVSGGGTQVTVTPLRNQVTTTTEGYCS